jgi:ureidoglycolate lyase
LKKIIAKPLTQKDFAPFGEVLTMPEKPDRVYFQAALGNLRPHASPSISTILKEPSNGLPFEIKVLERHEFSSQSFMPAQVKTWMIVVAPSNQEGQPDLDLVQAFLADASHGITYRPNTWHHELTVFQEPAKFNIFMWRDQTSSDEEFFQVPPFWVTDA